MARITVIDPATGQPVTLNVPDGFKDLSPRTQTTMVKRFLDMGRDTGVGVPYEQAALNPTASDLMANAPSDVPREIVGDKPPLPFDAGDVSRVPEGQSIHYQGFDYTPSTGNYGIRTPENENVSTAALQMRDNASGLSKFYTSPFGSGVGQASTLGLGDEALRATGNPVAAEAAQQANEQARDQAPFANMAGEIVGSIPAAANLPAKAAAGVINAGTRAYRTAKGAVAGATVAAGSEATRARDGERLDAATNPYNLAFGAGVGGAVSRFLPSTPPKGLYGINPAPAGNASLQPPTIRITDPEMQQLDEYLAIAQPKGNAPAGADVQAAAARIGVEQPVGLVDPKFQETLAKPLLGQPARASLDRLGRQLDEVGGEAVRVNTDGPRPPNVSTRAGTELERRSESLSEQYDAFFDARAPRDTMFPVHPDSKAVVDDVMLERIAAGGKKTSTFGISEAIDLLSRDEASIGGLRRARTSLRNLAAQTPDTATLLQGDIAKVVTAIDDQLADVVRATGGDRALDRMRMLDRSYSELAADRSALKNIIGETDSKAYSAIQKAVTGGGDEALKQLTALSKSLGAANWNNAMGATLYDMGTNGRGRFDADKFALQWNKLPNETKLAMFDLSHIKHIDDVVKVSNHLFELRQVPKKELGLGQIVTRGLGLIALPGYGAEVVAATVGGLRYNAARLMAKPATAAQLSKSLNLIADAQRVGGSKGAKMMEKATKIAKSLGAASVDGGTAALSGAGVGLGLDATIDTTEDTPTP